MNSDGRTRHHSLSADDLLLKAKGSGNEEHVTVNLRRLIQDILASYSSDFFVFRELIQNADDAKASSFTLEIKCDAPSSAEEIDFHNCVITEIYTTNDGLVFSETDWKRVATIADGNTDATSVGRFGVGFFSVFSYTEQPIIVSGKEYMIFAWRNDISLTTVRQKLPIEEQTKTTSILLKMKEKHVLRIKSNLNTSKTVNTVVPTIKLSQLKAYFAKVLSFTRHIVNLVIKINHLTVFEIDKRKMTIPPNENKWVFRPQPSIGNMLLLDTFTVTNQVLTVANGPSITLGHVTVEARLNIAQEFHDHIRRILHKSLPSIIQIQLLFVPIDTIIDQQQLQSSTANNDLNTQIFNSILPLKFVEKEIVPTGLIFIGLGTQQSTGIGMHVCSHLIPTVERENIDLQDSYIESWNKELLASIGQIARCIYDQIIIHNVPKERYDAVIAPYSFQSSTPNKDVGAIILNGFFTSNNQILVPVKRLPSDPHLSLVSSTQAFLAESKYVQSFLSFPLVPFDLTKNRFFTVLKERQLINHLYKTTITSSIAASILSSIQLIELLNWICSDDVDDIQYIKQLFSKLRFQETANSHIICFGQLHYYDASHISSVIPLPTNVLSTNIANHFSEHQLQKKLFLVPCTFKAILNSYLNKSQHYLLHNSKTAACLLSQFSKHWNQFSQHQCTQIKNILSVNQCIPTKQGMKLPKDSYIPSRILKPDLPIITLNLVPHKAIETQTNDSHSDDDLVSVDFLKQIGCRMLHIQSLIDSLAKSSDNLEGMDYQSMEILIENLIQERKNMTDTDFNALKQSQFLRGTTLESTEETMQTYIPQDLHFSFVAEKLNWSNLSIIDWKDIDPHSAAYAFLKELGVREAPDIHILINRIVDEHDHIKSRTRKRRKNYKIPISLRFFAENFQKHYSTLWHTINIQQPFLPSYLSTNDIDADVILSAPDRVFTDSNPLCALLLPEVVTLFKSHLNISSLGIKAQLTLSQAFDILMKRKDELLIYEWACDIFGYLNELDGRNREFKERLSKIAFILVQGKATLMKPTEIFIRSNESSITSPFENLDTSGLIDYVDFGPAANSFLVGIGVRNYPSPSMLAELLIDRQANYFANLTEDSEAINDKLHVYTQCLKQLARAAISGTSDLQNEPIRKRLRNEPWCLAVRRLIEPNNDKPKKDCRIMRPAEIYLNDDPQCADSHNPWCSPNEPILFKLYEQFGAKWLSDCVSRQLKKKGKVQNTDRSGELHTLIQTRFRLLFVDKRGEELRGLNQEHVEQLHSDLSVYEADNIQCRLTFQKKTITLDGGGSTCMLTQKENRVMLYFQKDPPEFDYLDIATEIARFVFKNPPEFEIHMISQKLSLSLEMLTRHGFPVERLIVDRQLDEPSIWNPEPPIQSPPKPTSPRPNPTSLRPNPTSLRPNPTSPRRNPTPQKRNGLVVVLGVAAYPFFKIGRLFTRNQPNKSSKVKPDGKPAAAVLKTKTSPIKENRSIGHIDEPICEPKNPTNDNDQEPLFVRVFESPPVVFGPVDNFKPDEKEVEKRMVRILASQPYRDPTMTRQKQLTKEICISCIENPTVDMICIDDRRLPIRLYIERTGSVTDKMIHHAQQLAWVLMRLATDVFEIPSDSIHLFRDINGHSIAFNCNKALFFNLRYFEQVYADNLRIYLQRPKATNDIVSRIVNFYFVVTCHELTHNIHFMHDLRFLRTLEEVIVEFMPRKESFLAQFSFDNYMSNTTETF